MPLPTAALLCASAAVLLLCWLPQPATAAGKPRFLMQANNEEPVSVPPPALERFVSQVLNGDHSACGGKYQAGNVYVSLVNAYHFRLLMLRRKALELESQLACVESQARETRSRPIPGAPLTPSGALHSQSVTVCIDEGCMNECR